MKAYADLTTLKSATYLNVTGTGEDTRFRALLEAASEEIDKLTHRFFECQEGTRYYDGDYHLLFPGDDILSITTLKLDLDGDGVFETSLAATDYHMKPLNSYPKTYLEIAYGGDYSDFARSLSKAIEITGVFGFGNGVSATPYTSGGTLGAAVSDTTGTSVTMTAGHSVAAGHTIRIDSEQMYVQVVAANTLTVKRGVNGTTAATHSNSTAVYIYEYPAPITQACLMQASLWKKRGEVGYTGVSINEVTGQTIIHKGLDPNVELIISSFVSGAGRLLY